MVDFEVIHKEVKRIKKRNITSLGIVSIGLSLLVITGVALISDQNFPTSIENLSTELISNCRSNTDTVLHYEEDIPTHPPIFPGDSSSGESSADPGKRIAKPSPTATPIPIVTPIIPQSVTARPEETVLSTPPATPTPTSQPPFPVVPMAVIMVVVVSLIMIIGGVPQMLVRENSRYKFNPRTKR
jgi:hypothetical protein